MDLEAMILEITNNKDTVEQIFEKEIDLFGDGTDEKYSSARIRFWQARSGEEIAEFEKIIRTKSTEKGYQNYIKQTQFELFPKNSQNLHRQLEEIHQKTKIFILEGRNRQKDWILFHSNER